MDRHTKEFKELKAYWDQVLKDTGFNDIEQPDEKLKVWSNRFKLRPELEMESKREYYRAAGQFLHHYPFDNKVEKRIWELHSQGIGKIRIVGILKVENLWFEKTRKAGWPRTPNDFTVRRILKKLKQEMMKRIEDDRQNP